MKITNKIKYTVYFSIIVTLLCSAIVLLSICVCMLHNEKLLLKAEIKDLSNTIVSGYSSVNENISCQSNEIKENIVSLKDTTTASQRRVQNNISYLQNTYSSILQEESKHHVSDTDKDLSLNQAQEQAKTLFSQHNYSEAFKKYSGILTFQEDNKDIRFYTYYSLFLSNKMDSSQYKIIINEFSALEKSGYTRNEITETLEYIKNETAQ